MDVLRNLLERDVHQPLFVDRIALNLDSLDVAGDARVRMRTQDNICRLADAEPSGEPLVDVAYHPDGARGHQGEHRLAGIEGIDDATEFEVPRYDPSVIRSIERIVGERGVLESLLRLCGLQRGLRDRYRSLCGGQIGFRNARSGVSSLRLLHRNGG